QPIATLAMMSYDKIPAGQTMSKRRITLDLDEEMLRAMDHGAADRRQSRSQFIAASLRRTLREIERERVDAAFERMSEDAAYQAEVLQIERELSPSSDAAWRLIDAAERRDGGSL